MNNYEGIYIPVYIINLPERLDRREHILFQFEGRNEFYPTIINACKHSIGAVGLWHSIVNAVSLAKEQGDDVMILCEDDHKFTDNYDKAKFLDSIIKCSERGAEIIIGGVGGFGMAIPVMLNHFWLDWFWSTQFVVIYRNSFDKILSYKFNDCDTADGVFSEIFTNKLTYHPFISIQHNFGYSDVTASNNSKTKVDDLFKSSSQRISFIKRVMKIYE